MVASDRLQAGLDDSDLSLIHCRRRVSLLDQVSLIDQALVG